MVFKVTPVVLLLSVVLLWWGAGTGFENRTFMVRLGETLLLNGSVRASMTAGCHYEERWTLTSGQYILQHRIIS